MRLRPLSEGIYTDNQRYKRNDNRDYAQQLINADIERYNYDAQRQLQALSTYNQLVSGSYGGTSNTTGQQSTGSRLGNALGGAMSGAGLVGALATNPAGWMVGTGAALGGLLGLI